MRSHLALLALFTSSLVACQSSSVSSTPSAASASASAVSARSAAPVSGPSAAAWHFADRPSAADVTPGPICGEANGSPIEIKAVVIQPELGTWTLLMGEQPLPDPTFPHLKGQYMGIHLPKGTPKAGSVFTKALKNGEAYFQISSGSGTSTWNADNAWYVQIDAWEATPYDPKANPYQVVGKASGKVYVSFEGSSERKSSGVAGVFKDAPVRYLGKPALDP